MDTRALFVVPLLPFFAACAADDVDPDAGPGSDASVLDASTSDDAMADPDGGMTEIDAGSDAGSDAGPPAEPCVAFEDGVEHGGVPLDELSGLAASRRNGGLIYAHDDSGGAAAVYALDEDDATLRATLSLNGTTNIDFEDIAVGPAGDGSSAIWVGDVGDNAARTGSGTPRASIVVYRFPEPALDASMTVTMSFDVEALRFTYPDGPHDCESIAVDPDTGDLYLLSKENAGPATLFVARAPHAAGMRELELVTTVAVSFAVGMDMSPGGGGLLVRTGGGLSLFLRGAAEDWSDAVARAPTAVPVEPEPQGEAVAWARDGRGYWTASEGNGEPLYFYAATDPTCVGP